MAEVYAEKPEVLEVTLAIDGDSSFLTRYVIGKSPKNIHDAVSDALNALALTETVEVKPKKSRKPRRSKQEMLDSKPDSIQEEIADEPKAEKKGKPWHD